MWELVFAIIFWVIALCFIASGFLTSGDSNFTAPARFGAAALCVVLGIAFYAFGGIKSVPPKTDGIPISFNAVSGSTLGPGTHWTWEPWLGVVDIDKTVQTTTFEPGGTNGVFQNGTTSCDGSLPVRIGGNFQACAKVTLQWQILDSAAPGLFQDFANQGDLMTTITNAVVIRELEQVVNNVVGDYSPITDTTNVTANGATQSQFTGFSNQILAQMRHDIGSRIDVESVLFPNMQYPAAVEAQLQAIQKAAANLVIAKENVLVNQQNALAFAKLGNPTVPQLEAECLGDMKDGMVADTGFQCFAGAGSNLAISGK
jgi:regulator of protease activity HflC (stomatin/prohibitin superfamily)